MHDDYIEFVKRMGSCDLELDIEDESLAHYGVLGMKWGRRRNSTSATTGKQTIGKKALNKLKKKEDKLQSMSDVDLRAKINRLQMEKQYKQLTQPERTRGREFVETVISNSAKQTATQYTSKYMSYGVEEALNKYVRK